MYRFPLQEYGMNFEAQPLQKHEITAMKEDPQVLERLERSYEMMLGFYGMELVSKETGELRRAANWEERYRNLVRKCHSLHTCQPQLTFRHRRTAQLSPHIPNSEVPIRVWLGAVQCRLPTVRACGAERASAAQYADDQR